MTPVVIAPVAVVIMVVAREVRAYRRRQAHLARVRAAGVINFAPAAARGRTRRPVPPAVSPTRRSRG